LTAASRVKLRRLCGCSPTRWNGEAILDAIDVAASEVVTPLMFQYR